MEKILCPHCQLLSEDLEYCDHCGREIGTSQTETSAQQEETDWSQDTLVCDTYIRPGQAEIIPEIPSVIESPIHTEPLKDDMVKLYFLQSEKRSLPELLEQNGPLSFENITTILKRMGTIFTAIHEAGYILGSFNLTDFWGEDLESFQLRPIRTIRVKGMAEKFGDNGEFAAPEMGTARAIDESADVFLLGHLFLSFVFDRKQPFSDYNELRYLSHQLQAFRPEIPFTLHTWLEKSTNLSPVRRYHTVSEQIEAFKQALWQDKQRRGNHPEILEKLFAIDLSVKQTLAEPTLLEEHAERRKKDINERPAESENSSYSESLPLNDNIDQSDGKTDMVNDVDSEIKALTNSKSSTEENNEERHDEKPQKKSLWNKITRKTAAEKDAEIHGPHKALDGTTYTIDNEELVYEEPYIVMQMIAPFWQWPAGLPPSHRQGGVLVCPAWVQTIG